MVYAALPPAATPTDTACHPLARHVLEKAQGDVVELAKGKMSAEFAGQRHVVVVIKAGDLDPETDAELFGLLKQTHGGVLVYGVSYTLDARTGPTESCPECGATSACPISSGASATPAAGSGDLQLWECRDCGAVWDA